MTKPEFISAEIGTRVTAHALHVGDRINTIGFETEALSAIPLAIRVDTSGVAVLFRYGVAVLIGLASEEQSRFLETLKPRIDGKLARREEEAAILAFAGEGETEDQVLSGGPIQLRDMSPARLLVVADVLAKSVVLAHDEREVAKVFEIIEPFAKELADHGRTRRDRKGVMQLIGSALLVQHRVSGRVAIGEKPDALWDRPDLERLYARLEDEYELKERLDALNRKLAVVAETANTLADIIDTRRTLRLELIIVGLIAFEVIITLYQLYTGKGH
ncbi:RMD1 family protein [Bradyrhizobium sp. AUGA SZCCT0222]|uniref:RMD1 family protein n=1 Tax=unclassified Bradyrhizobium TaxID=2631580 RepID=UPI001BAADE6C|nr:MULTISPECIES: RMD1 family protein [unclassified Bradyrhizobium]MBR1236591.1 RMD1 family protein [Bradyrhizobium sp. AUGA SZCCT0182]MBR1270204.1 RMD1 family protein [Bradyrhizobium sp. AUGA SZCCT0222]